MKRSVIIGIAVIIVFAGLIVFQLTATDLSTEVKTDKSSFFKMLSTGDVKKINIADKRKSVKIYVKEDSLYKYERELKDVRERLKKGEPQFYMHVVSGENFKDELDDFYNNNPMVRQVAIYISKR